MTVEQQEAILAAESAIMQDIAHLTPRTRHKDSARMIALRGSLRSANAMRDAYVLKEILDKPLALRDPQAERAAT